MACCTASLFRTLPRVVLFAAVLLGLGAAGLVQAVDDANLSVERIAGDGWTAHDIAIDWDLPERASATIGKLRRTAIAQELHDVRVVCPRLELSVRAIACERARVTANLPGLGAQTFTAGLIYGRSDGSLSWRVEAAKQRASVEALVAVAKRLRLPIPAVDARIARKAALISPRAHQFVQRAFRCGHIVLDR